MKTESVFDAIRLVALAMHAKAKEGTPEHKKAAKMVKDATELWREYGRAKTRCKHCGQPKGESK